MPNGPTEALEAPAAESKSEPDSERSHVGAQSSAPSKAPATKKRPTEQSGYVVRMENSPIRPDVDRNDWQYPKDLCRWALHEAGGGSEAGGHGDGLGNAHVQYYEGQSVITVPVKDEPTGRRLLDTIGGHSWHGHRMPMWLLRIQGQVSICVAHAAPKEQPRHLERLKRIDDRRLLFPSPKRWSWNSAQPPNARWNGPQGVPTASAARGSRIQASVTAASRGLRGLGSKRRAPASAPPGLTAPYPVAPIPAPSVAASMSPGAYYPAQAPLPPYHPPYGGSVSAPTNTACIMFHVSDDLVLRFLHEQDPAAKRGPGPGYLSAVPAATMAPASMPLPVGPLAAPPMIPMAMPPAPPPPSPLSSPPNHLHTRAASISKLCATSAPFVPGCVHTAPVPSPPRTAPPTHGSARTAKSVPPAVPPLAYPRPAGLHRDLGDGDRPRFVSDDAERAHRAREQEDTEDSERAGYAAVPPIGAGPTIANGSDGFESDDNAEPAVAAATAKLDSLSLGRRVDDDDDDDDDGDDDDAAAAAAVVADSETDDDTPSSDSDSSSVTGNADVAAAADAAEAAARL